MEILAWHWLIWGGIWLIGELLSGTLLLLFLGGAAVLMAAVVWLIPGLGWMPQTLIFAVLITANTALWLQYWRKKNGNNADNGQPALNQRGAAMLGRTVVVTEAIVGGVGRGQLDDSTWRLLGEDAPVGAQLVVHGVDGSSLRVG